MAWAEWAQTGASTFSGYALDREDLSRRLVIELLVDGFPAAITRADLYHDRLAALGVADGCFGFRFALAPEILAGAARICARIANTDRLLPAPDAGICSTFGRSGAVEWLGGLRFRGWLAARAVTPWVYLQVDGEDLGGVAADLWSMALADGALAPVRGFEVTLPDRFADGVVHRVSFTPRTADLPAISLPFLAFADGLRAQLEEHGLPGPDLARIELFDRLFPRALPFERYEDWRAALPLVPPSLASDSVSIGVIVLGEAGLERTLDSLAAQADAAIVGVFATDPAQVEFDPAALHDFMREQAQTCEVFLVLPSGATLHAGVLARIAQGFASQADALCAHLDFDLTADDGTLWPMALPAYDYERTLEQGFYARAFALRRRLLDAALRRGARSVFRLANACYDPEPDSAAVEARSAPVRIEGPLCARLFHLPGASVILPADLVRAGAPQLKQATLDHLRLIGAPATCQVVAGSVFPAVRVIREARAERLSVVVNAIGPAARVRAGLDSLLPALQSRTADLILLVDQTPPSADLLEPFRHLPIRQLPVAHLSPATALNVALRRAGGDVVVHVAAGLQFADAAWLEELVGRVRAPGVAAAACLLRAPGDGVGDAGYVLGPRFDALPGLTDRAGPDPGPGDLLRVAHEVGALSWGCIALDARAFAAIGGLDDLNFPSVLYDVDVSLRLRAQGARLVLTPHARARLTLPVRPDGRMAQARRARELARLRARWGEDLARDPYYSPILTQDGLPFSALSWPPAHAPARGWRAPHARALPAGL